MPNLSALAPFTTSATALSNLVLVTPQAIVGYNPQLKSGETGNPPEKILFHYEGEQTLTIESDITDHYVEDNTAVQDQIALKPEVITTHGFIGELNDVVPEALSPIKIAADKLTAVVAYQPALTTTAQIAYSEAFFLYQVGKNAANSAVAAWDTVGSLLGGESVSQNQQQRKFQQFYGYWRERRLFTVQTPWAVFKDMAIKSLRAIQDADTRMVTDFEVSFKRIRNASTSTSNASIDQTFQNRAAAQASDEQNLGTSVSTPSPDDPSLDSGIVGMGAK